MIFNDKIVIIIPAFNPNNRLIELIENLKAAQFQNIIVVNDGSVPECNNIFQSIKNSCTVLHHAVNLGKGRALKTAFNHFLNHFPEFLGVVTVDSDGQHDIKDIKNISSKLNNNINNLILGARNFSEDNIPFRSRFGNILTSKIVSFACGMNIIDTQTGLRGIPTSFLKKLMNVNGERFEYEMNMLLECKIHDVKIEEVNIQTIYLDENKSSHFNPIIDSIKIYLVFIKYLFSSLASFGVDIFLFYIMIKLLKNVMPVYYVFASSIISRIVSSMFNYKMNKSTVFKLHSKNTMFKYFTLSFFQMLFSSYGVHYIFYLIGHGEMLIKICIDAFLFFISFQIQQRWVFTHEKRS